MADTMNNGPPFPREVLDLIFRNLDLLSLISARQTCSEWRSVGCRAHLERAVSLKEIAQKTPILACRYCVQPLDSDKGDNSNKELCHCNWNGVSGIAILALAKLLAINGDQITISSNVSAPSPFKAHVSKQGRLIKKDKDGYDLYKTSDTFRVYDLASNPPRLEGRFQLAPLLEPAYAKYSFELDNLNMYAVFYHDRQIRIYNYYPGNVLGDIVYRTDSIVPRDQWIDYAMLNGQLLMVKIKQGPCLLVDITTGEQLEVGTFFRARDERGDIPSVEVIIHDQVLAVSVYPFNSTLLFGENDPDQDDGYLFPFYRFRELLESKSYRELPLRNVVPLGPNIYFGLSSRDESLNRPLICRVTRQSIQSYELLPQVHISMSFSHDKRLVALAGADHTIYIYYLDPKLLGHAFDNHIPLPYRTIDYETELTMPRSLTFVNNTDVLAEFRVSSDTDNYLLFRKYQISSNCNGTLRPKMGGHDWDIADCGHVQDAKYHKPRPRSVVTQVGRDIWGDLSNRLPICRHQLLRGMFV